MLNVIAGIVALIHIYIFFLESILWGKPKTRKAFGVSEADSEVCRAFAFNQGFYNLFLSIAIIIGFTLQLRGLYEGRVLIDYAVASVFGAGIVLLSSNRKLLRPAMIQSLPALLYLFFRVFV